jgi:hypothetical protein
MRCLLLNRLVGGYLGSRSIIEREVLAADQLKRDTYLNPVTWAVVSRQRTVRACMGQVALVIMPHQLSVA